MNKLFTALLFLPPFLITLPALAQKSPVYKTLVSPNVKIKRNISYAVPPGKDISNKYYLLDIYRPSTGSKMPRALVIMMHGGAFKLGNKESNSTPVFCKSFAQAGFVCASINYRLSSKNPLTNYKDRSSACYDALADLQKAISFLKANAAAYQIDTNHIILAGNSAGGMLALQAVYSNPEELVKCYNSEPPAGLQREPFAKNITAVVNCWGAIFDTSWLQNNKVPVISIHGSNDRVVSMNITDSTMYGSEIIHRQLNQLGHTNVLKVYDGIGHELSRHFNPLWTGPVAKKRCREAAREIVKFLAAQIAVQQKMQLTSR